MAPVVGGAVVSSSAAPAPDVNSPIGANVASTSIRESLTDQTGPNMCVVPVTPPPRSIGCPSSASNSGASKFSAHHIPYQTAFDGFEGEGPLARAEKTP